MTRGALVSSGVVIAVTDAADGLNLHYQTDADGNWVAFVPDATADVGDSWDGSSFTYQHVRRRRRHRDAAAGDSGRLEFLDDRQPDGRADLVYRRLARPDVGADRRAI